MGYAPLTKLQCSPTSDGSGAAIVAEPAEGTAFDPFHPANIAPLVAYLATEACPLRGTTETTGAWTIEDVQAWIADWA